MESTTPISNIPAKSTPNSFVGFLTRLIRAREFTLVVLVVAIGLALQLITGRFFTVPNINAISLSQCSKEI